MSVTLPRGTKQPTAELFAQSIINLLRVQMSNYFDPDTREKILRLQFQFLPPEYQDVFEVRQHHGKKYSTEQKAKMRAALDAMRAAFEAALTGAAVVIDNMPSAEDEAEG